MLRLSHIDILLLSLCTALCYGQVITHCEQTYQATANRRSISSPDYPATYPDNIDACVTTITAGEGQQIQLDFEMISIETHDDCIYDYVEVRDGDSSDSPSLGRYCGSFYQDQLPGSITSIGNSLWIKFHSDTDTTANGFSAYFALSVTHCEQTYQATANRRSISSPNYPASYPDNIDACVTTITAGEGQQIQLVFEEFATEDHSDCDYDYVEVRDGDSSDSPSLGRYCGSSLPGSITSIGNSLWIKFHSDENTNADGFSAYFALSVINCPKPTIPNGAVSPTDATLSYGHSYTVTCNSGYILADSSTMTCKEGNVFDDTATCKVNHCEQTYQATANRRSISSPDYPASYPDNIDACVTTITAGEGQQIQLVFEMISIETHDDCGYDYVEVRDGDSSDSFSLGRFCGTFTVGLLPGSFTSIGNSLLIIFHSDQNTNANGFLAYFVVIAQDCPKPTIPNGFVSPSDATISYGESYEVICNSGYRLSGLSTMTCRGGNVFDNNPICQDCGCNPNGAIGCTSSGECICKENVGGVNCDECEVNHYGFADNGYNCYPCECNPYGTIDSVLDCDINGYCPCKQNRINTRKCDGCPEGQTIDASGTECEDCNCHPRGAVDTSCDLYTGECECIANVYGISCDTCRPGHYGISSYGECQPCGCDPFNSLSQQCDQDSGQCPCYDNIVFLDSRSCSGCPAGQYSQIPGTCEHCNCNPYGAVDTNCDMNTGRCTCKPNFVGDKCDNCELGYYEVPGACTPCNCNPFGVTDAWSVCDPATGQCGCKPGRGEVNSRTCDGCRDGYYMDSTNTMECISCYCSPYGAVDTNCDLYSGRCNCKPGFVGDKCDSCEIGFFNTPGGCEPCFCNPYGVTGPSQCDPATGQCSCKPGRNEVNSRTCDGCRDGYYIDSTTPAQECISCSCSPYGAVDTNCDLYSGRCLCQPGFVGDKCDSCELGFYEVPGACTPCSCNPPGVTGPSAPCDPITGQCSRPNRYQI